MVWQKNEEEIFVDVRFQIFRGVGRAGCRTDVRFFFFKKGRLRLVLFVRKPNRPFSVFRRFSILGFRFRKNRSFLYDQPCFPPFSCFQCRFEAMAEV